MPESLDPLGARRNLHEQDEPADQDAQGAGRNKPGRHSRILQIAEAALLAFVTLTAAWAGFAAAKWETKSRVDVARSEALRNLATRADLTATSLRNLDASMFNAWYLAWTLNDHAKEVVAERRFRPAFRVAFKAWMATDPLHSKHAPPEPTFMPQYKLAAQARANALDRAASVKFAVGSLDGDTSDNYIRITVLLAAVLFLVGIGSTFKLHGVRYSLIMVGCALLVAAVVLILQQPGLPD